MTHIRRIFFLGLLIAALQGCKETTDSIESSSRADQTTQSGCTLNGVTVQDGKSRMFYVSQVESSSCSGQTRKCTSGVLSGSDLYKYSSCSVSRSVTGGGSGTSNASCTWNGNSVPSGTSIVAYQSTKAAAGQTCTSISQSRMCVNGKLAHIYGANDIGYNYATCVDNDPCSFNSVSIPHEQSVTAYKSATVPMSSSCDRIVETRKCINGSLSGSFTSASCVKAAPSCAITLTNFVDQVAVTSVVRDSSMAIRWSAENSDSVDSFQCSHSDLTASSNIPSPIYTVPYGLIAPVQVPNKVGTFTCSLKAKSSTYESTCSMSITILPKVDLVVDTRYLMKLLYNVDAYLDPSADFAISTVASSAYQQICPQYGVKIGRDLPLKVKGIDCRTSLPSVGNTTTTVPVTTCGTDVDGNYSCSTSNTTVPAYIINPTFTTQRRLSGTWSVVTPLNSPVKTSLTPAGTGSTGCSGGYLKTITCGE